jgi:hypothetical protein
MLKSKLIAGMCVLISAGMAATSARADSNLLTNGDFSAGNTGFSTGYDYSPGNLYPANSYDVVSNPNNDHPLAVSYGDHTTGTGLMLALNGAGSSSTPAWSETVSVTPGDDYAFVGYLSSWSQGYGPVADLDLVINGSNIGDTLADETAGIWNQFSGSWNAGGATSATITLYDLQTAPNGNDFSLDDLSFADTGRQVGNTAAPTPASGMAALAGFAVIALAKKLGRRTPELV